MSARKSPTKSLVLLSMLGLTLSLVAPANAAVKTGATCSPLGKVSTVNNSKFTCIKSGKKLVWSKPVKIAPVVAPVAPTPVAPTPIAPVVDTSSLPIYKPEGCHAKVSATLQKQDGSGWVDLTEAQGWEPIASCDANHPYQPFARISVADGTVIRWRVYSPGNWEWFSTSLTVKTLLAPKMGVKIAEISSEKYADVATIAQNSVTSDMPAVSTIVPVKYIIEDSIFPIEVALIKNGVNSALSHYSPFFDPKKTVHVFVFGTSQFLKNEAPKADPSNVAFAEDMARQSITWGTRSSSNCTGMGGFAVSEVPFPFIAIDAPCTTNDPAAYGVLPHELTHTLQINVGKANPRCWAPTWFVEGQAQVGASALAYDENGPASVAHRKSWVDRIVKPNSIDEILAMEGETKDFSEYTLGAALSEYLVAKGGWKRSVNLYSQALQQVSSGCLGGSEKIDNFDKAFQTLYGQTLAEFYAEALPYLRWIADRK